MNLFSVYPLYDVTPAKAKDCFVWDENNVKYLDLYSGHGVISVGHTHPDYVARITVQIKNLGFYSNAVKNPLQVELAEKLGKLSNCQEYNLFLCNSGAEANENALKAASFYTDKSRVVSFKNAFHGRTSAAVAATDNPNINAPINSQQIVTFLELNDSDAVENELKKGDVCAVIIEGIQGVGGLDQGTTAFFKSLEILCEKYNVILILDEIQSGYGRSGKFFAFQHHNIKPDIITTAKGMGNGFPIGGVLISPKIQASFGMLGTTFGGNHLACAAVISVLEIIEKENLIANAKDIGDYFLSEIKKVPKIKKIKGRGLMVGVEFDFEVGDLRNKLIYDYHIFTGGAMNKKLLRILPPLTVKKEHINTFINALKELLA